MRILKIFIYQYPDNPIDPPPHAVAELPCYLAIDDRNIEGLKITAGGGRLKIDRYDVLHESNKVENLIQK